MIPASDPSVGLFWGSPEASSDFRLLITTVALSQAEPYGDCLTDGRGHLEVWNRWRALSPRELKALDLPITIKQRPYDAWPRGRVAYEIRTRRFIIYADRRLHGRSTVAKIETAFALRDCSVLVRADDHYRTRP
jgi:hypothetical protein